MNYRPEIDGLRTIAVIPVILTHGGFLAGGFIGVDVFFVISGYLITTILLDEIERGDFSVLRFYERRSRRIMPALFTVMACCIPFAWLWMHQTELKDFFESLTTTSLFLSNVLFWSESGYFDAVAENKPLLHTWSLAVEEQYYLIFPLLLWLIMKGGRIVAAGVLLLIAAASLIAAFVLDTEPEAKFFLIQFRFWELLAGSLCAYAIRFHMPQSNGKAALAGLAIILGGMAVVDHETAYPLFALSAVIGTALIILFASAETWAGKVLSLRPMVGIGLISYSAYLWHQPLFAFARIKWIGAPPLWLMGVLALGALGLAYLSWRFIEQPFRGRSPRALPRRWQVLSATGAGILAFSLLGWYGHEEEGFPDRPVIRTLVQPMIDARYERFRSWDVLDGKVPARFNLKAFDVTGDGPRVLILGDSHSKGLFNAFYQHPDLFPGLQMRRGAIGFNCFEDATSPAENEACVDAVLADHAPLLEGATHVIFAARWMSDDRMMMLDWLPARLAARGMPMVIAGNTAEFATEGPVIIANIARDTQYDGSQPFLIDRANRRFWEERRPQVAARSRELQAKADALNIPVLNRYKLVCDDAAQSCAGVTPSGEALTYDYGHWTLAGSAMAGRRIAETGWLKLP